MAKKRKAKKAKRKTKKKAKKTKMKRMQAAKKRKPAKRSAANAGVPTTDALGEADREGSASMVPDVG